MRSSFGVHLILDAWECDIGVLDDECAIRAAVVDAVTAGGATLIELCVHRFSPQGVTATATLAESHLAIHTWPERGYCAADAFFCHSGDPDAALASLRRSLGCRAWDVRRVERRIGSQRERRRDEHPPVLGLARQSDRKREP